MPLISSLGIMNAISFGLDSALVKTPIIGLIHNSATLVPNQSIYPWNKMTGFGTKYPNPSYWTSATTSYGLDINTTGNAICLSSTNIAAAYRWKEGFGTKYPVILSGTCYGVKYSKNNLYLAVATSSITSSYVYNWTDTDGAGTKFANPTTLPSSVQYSVTFNDTSSCIAYGLSASPNTNIYAWSSTGFGAKYANASTLYSGYCTGLDFNSSNTALATGVQGSPYIAVFPWDDISGFGTKYTNPSILPSGAVGYAAKFSKNESYIACSHSSSPSVSVYPWNNSTGFGTKFANPSTVLATGSRSVDFSVNEDNIAISCLTSPYIAAYSFSSSGFGAKFSDPSSLPTGQGNWIKFST